MARRELSGSDAERVIRERAVGHAAAERFGEYEILGRVVRWKRICSRDTVAAEASDWIEDGGVRNPTA